MCNFLSAVLTRTGQLYCEPECTDSHSHIISAHGLKEGANSENFVRLEFSPTDPLTICDLATYKLKIDEPMRPGWFDAEMEATAVAALSARVERMIVRGKKHTLLGGCWILAGDADVEQAVSARIISMTGSAQVGTMWETSQVGEMREASRVGTMWGTSRVGEMRETSQVGEMRETSQVGVMRETSQVGTMRGTSQVGVMWGTSRVGTMRGTSQVGVMWGTSQVGVMWEVSRVGVMRETSQVGTMRGTSQVGVMWGTSRVGTMRGTSQVGVMWVDYHKANVTLPCDKVSEPATKPKRSRKASS